MIFCKNCFRDPEIASIVEKVGHIGECPICGAKHEYLYDTQNDNSLDAIFDDLLSVYTAESDWPPEYPHGEMKKLADILKNDWNIFADISDELVLDILKSLSPDVEKNYIKIFEEPVGIQERYDLEYLKQHSILQAKEWSDFVHILKHQNRFHSKIINPDFLREYCLCIAEDIPVDHKRFYRGRIAKNPDGFRPRDMGAPPADRAVDGRANSAGISRLYLTDNRETTLHEIRAAEYDYVTIGTFKPMRTIRVVNLKKIAKISPFNTENVIDCTALAVNREYLSKINEELSHPLRRNDSALDYLPTQYIIDFIQSLSNDDGTPMFDGIKYQSAMHSKGSNLTIFNPELFKCTYCNTYEVIKLGYCKKPITRRIKDN